MSNSRRIDVAGETYHVNGNVLDGMSLFRDDTDRLAFLDLLAAEVERSRWTVLIYTLMTTHYHLLLTPQEATLSSGFQHLHSLYARRYNRRHERRGVVWQKRFHDEMIQSEGHLRESIRYIALNAPRANICTAAEDWPWCSYGAAVGDHCADPLVDEDALLGLFAESSDVARRRLRAYVDERDPRERWRQTRLGRGSDAEQ